MAERKSNQKKVLKGTTKSGFSYEIDMARLEDYEILEMLAEVEAQPLLSAKIIEMILGKAQKEKLKDHVRDSEGRVPITDMMKEIEEMLQTQSELKN